MKLKEVGEYITIREGLTVNQVINIYNEALCNGEQTEKEKELMFGELAKQVCRMPNEKVEIVDTEGRYDYYKQENMTVYEIRGYPFVFMPILFKEHFSREIKIFEDEI